MNPAATKKAGRRAPVRINKNANHATTWPFIERTFPQPLWESAYQEWQKGPKSQLAILYRHVLDKREDGRPLAIKTLSDSKQTVFQVFADLKTLGYPIHNVLSLRTKHIMVIAEKWRKDQVQPGTVSARLSKLRRFCTAIGKAGLIPHQEKLGAIGLAPEDAARTSVAKFDKSWPPELADRLLEEAAKIDFRLELVLLVERHFGLRSKEAYLFKPHQDEENGTLKIERGTKGGRTRFIPIDSPDKQAALEKCKRLVKPGDSLSGVHRKLKQAKSWYSNGMVKLGATKAGDFGRTGHGLRHGFAHAELEKRGAPVAVKTPAGNPVTTSLAPAELKAARLEVSELLGHSRTSVTGAYSGTLRVSKGMKEAV